MGQPVTVVEKQSSNPAIVRFETNRPLSGMGHENYAAPPSELLDRPVDEVARRLFAAGSVESLHIYGSVITVNLGRGRTSEGLADIIRHMFLHYAETPDETVVVPLDEADATPEMAADPADTPAAQAAEEPAAADPPAPEGAVEVDAATTEPAAPGPASGAPAADLA
jgi:hypothetical protein